MKKDQLSPLFEALLFTLVLGSDRVTKMWALNHIGERVFGPVNFATVLNFGIAGGNFSHLPHVMKIMTLSSVGAFIFCLYLFARTFFPMKSQWLKLGLSIYISGILGNVWDRLIDQGAVVDFISFTILNWRTPTGNGADIFQIIGLFMIITGLIQDSRSFWFAKDQRSVSWVLPRLQWKLTLIITGLGLMCGIVTSVMSFAFLKVTLANEEQLGTFVAAISITQGALALVLFMIGSFVSGKIAGPLFAIHRYLVTAVKNDAGKFKLRSQDDFKEFEAPLNEANERLNCKEKKDAA